MKTLALSVVIGTVLTLVLFGLGWWAVGTGFETLSYGLYWQAYVLYQMLPCSVSINPGEFLCENMTVAKVTFFAGIPLGILVYSAAAYLVLRLVRRPSAAPQAGAPPAA